MPTIRQLPPSVINKIAAGEVIERPASVVKELLENAVDAGGTRIDVMLEQGGLQLIRIADNGCGIESDQLPLAVASHATSKIENADDLFRVQTLGFRGEALASIAEISHLLIRSRTSQSPSGSELAVEGGKVIPAAPCGCPVGTIIEIRNLFFNTPVRRKFMRSAQTELGHSSEAFTRIAVAYPAIHFTLRHNERVLFDLPPTASWSERITSCFGAEIGSDLIWVESQEGNIALRGFVANPSQSRSNNRLQYVFLNGRFIRDRALQHALGEAYRGLLLTGRFPIVFLRLELRPDTVDVNVHPTKLEVRFEDAGRVYSQLLSTLRTKFLSTDLTAKVSSPAAAPVPLVETQDALDDELLNRHRQSVASWARGDTDQAGATFGLKPSATAGQTKFDFQPQPAWRPLPEFKSFPGNPMAPPRPPLAEPPSPAIDRAAPTDLPASHPTTVERENTLQAGASTSVPRGMQIQNRYIVTETDDGMMVIDQHALHERILYEQIRKRVLSGKLETQRMLVPEPVSLTPPESAAALEAQSTLSQLGIEIEPFGGDTVLISAYPAMLSGLGPNEVLRNVVELLLAGGRAPDRRDLLDELLHMISCKAAIKAGDRLSLDEIHALLEQQHLFQDTHHCPHGRPTALVFSRDELDKRFKRT
jgi:DNA mismatch repair protein MutL